MSADKAMTWNAIPLLYQIFKSIKFSAVFVLTGNRSKFLVQKT